MAHRIAAIAAHVSAPPSESTATVTPHGCIGESSNLEVNEAVQRSFQRVALKVAFPDATQKDERYGGSGDVVVIEGELLKPATPSKTVLVFFHPSGIQQLLPFPNDAARAGLHVAVVCSRYPNNDTCVIMEKILFDISATIKQLKAKHGYERVVLAGWSGGGSLSSFYQSQAESPSVTSTPAGDPIDYSGGKLVPADAVLILAAHSSRARIFTEWLDPAVLDENDPDVRDPDLDLWNPKNKPPYSPEFVAKFRAAQLERNRRITKWAQQKLASIQAQQKHANPNAAEAWKVERKDHPFLVRCTQADPRRLDLTLEPNGRPPTSLAELASENHSPVGLARFTTCKSWLSQWAVELTNADGPRHLARVSKPVFVLANGADHLVPLSHPRAMFAAVTHDRKRYVELAGAGHYYFGQRKEMREGVRAVAQFLSDYGLLESDVFKAVMGRA